MASPPIAWTDTPYSTPVRTEPSGSFPCLSIALCIRGFHRSGFARSGEKIAKAIGRRGHHPVWLLVATGEFVS
jgi:hypothetical protein